MYLSTLLATAALPSLRLVGPGEAEIGGLAYDSRQVRSGDLFVALPGDHVDGHRFIDAAVERGAAAVLCRHAPEDSAIPHLIVPDTRVAMADLAAAFYAYPSDRLHVTGVTGTDGKTTTSFLLHALLQETGHPAGLISTVAFRLGERLWENETRQTTPDSPDVQRLLAEMVAARLGHAVVEASSHALVLQRLRHCHIDVGVFTNLTSDHLDFHGSIESYREAKSQLFRSLGHHRKPEVGRPMAIVNRDDPSYDYMAAASAVPVLAYGLHPAAAVRAEAVTVSAGGITFRAVTPEGVVAIDSPLTGRFNVSNLLAALAAALAYGIGLGDAAAVLHTFAGVPGRMRRVEAGQPFTVIVDYAHTPDSLSKVLDELRAVTEGRLLAVFGAAGERDRGKRPLMGRSAAQRCDLMVLTDEDPRLEDRQAIIEEIAAGARAAGARDGETLLLIPDRRAAVTAALRAARPGDTVLLAGKGHEGCIIMGDERLPWNEEEEARAALTLLGLEG